MNLELKQTLFIVLLLVTLLPVTLLAQVVTEAGAATGAEAAYDATEVDEETAHDALRELRAIYEQAVNENRVELLEPYLDSEFTGVMVTGELVENFADLQNYWQGIQEQLRGGTYVTKVEPDLSWIQDDIAIAKGTTTDLVTMANGTEFPFTAKWTAVLVYRDGTWKLRRMQGTMDPIGNSFVAAIRRQAMIWSAVIAGLFGLILGFFIGSRRRKKV